MVRPAGTSNPMKITNSAGSRKTMTLPRSAHRPGSSDDEPVEEQEDHDDHSEPESDRDQCVPQVTHVHFPPTVV